jgi:hypothetical protein
MNETRMKQNNSQMMDFEISRKLTNWRKSNAPSNDVSR